MKKPRGRFFRLKLFGISLLVSTVVLCVFYLPTILPLISALQGSTSVLSSSYLQPQPPERSGSLLVTVSLSKNTGDVFFLITMGKKEEVISVTSLPAEFACPVYSRYKTLREAFSAEGAAGAAKAVAEALMIDEPEWVSVDTTSLIQILDNLGSFQYTNQNPIQYEDARTGFSVEIEAGETQITGLDFASLLLYHRIIGTEMENFNTEAEILTAMINQTLCDEWNEEMPVFLEIFYENAETSLPLSSYKSPTLAYFAINREGMARMISTEGEFSKDKTVFTASNGMITAIQEALA